MKTAQVSQGTNHHTLTLREFTVIMKKPNLAVLKMTQKP